MQGPDLDIRGTGGAVSKKFFLAVRASGSSKNKGGGGASPLDPPLQFHLFTFTIFDNNLLIYLISSDRTIKEIRIHVVRVVKNIFA